MSGRTQITFVPPPTPKKKNLVSEPFPALKAHALLLFRSNKRCGSSGGISRLAAGFSVFVPGFSVRSEHHPCRKPSKHNLAPLIRLKRSREGREEGMTPSWGQRYEMLVFSILGRESRGTIMLFTSSKSK